jgi:hypothetical protein
LQVEEGFHVDEGLAEFAIHGTKEIEWDRELENELVDHDKVAHGEVALDHAVAGEPHHCGERGGEDYALPGVEEGEGGGYFDGGVFVAFEGMIVAADFVFFVVKVLRESLEGRLDRRRRWVGIPSPLRS